MAIWKRLREYRDKDMPEEVEEEYSKLEKKDFLALWISAMLTLWLPVLLILLFIGGLMYLLFGGFR